MFNTGASGSNDIGKGNLFRCLYFAKAI